MSVPFYTAFALAFFGFFVALFLIQCAVWLSRGRLKMNFFQLRLGMFTMIIANMVAGHPYGMPFSMGHLVIVEGSPGFYAVSILGLAYVAALVAMGIEVIVRLLLLARGHEARHGSAAIAAE